MAEILTDSYKCVCWNCEEEFWSTQAKTKRVIMANLKQKAYKEESIPLCPYCGSENWDRYLKKGD